MDKFAALIDPTNPPPAEQVLDIKTRMDMIRATIYYGGHNLALIPEKRRNEFAIALLKITQNYPDVAPNPVWSKVLEDPDFYNSWADEIRSGEYEDENLDDDPQYEMDNLTWNEEERGNG